MNEDANPIPLYDNNSMRVMQGDRLFDTKPDPGDEVAMCFPGFGVFMTHEGVALVLSKGLVEVIRGFKDGQDRALLEFRALKPGDEIQPAAPEVYERLKVASLRVWPKENVP